MKRDGKSRSHNCKWELENHDKVNAYKRRWDKMNPVKVKAQRRVRRAIKAGKLVRPDHCEICNAKCKPVAHHADYTRPLDVVFLCPSCHIGSTHRMRRYRNYDEWYREKREVIQAANRKYHAAHRDEICARKKKARLAKKGEK
jgi:hypothetical protein